MKFKRHPFGCSSPINITDGLVSSVQDSYFFDLNERAIYLKQNNPNVFLTIERVLFENVTSSSGYGTVVYFERRGQIDQKQIISRNCNLIGDQNIGHYCSTRVDDASDAKNNLIDASISHDFIEIDSIACFYLQYGNIAIKGPNISNYNVYGHIYTIANSNSNVSIKCMNIVNNTVREIYGATHNPIKDDFCYNIYNSNFMNNNITKGGVIFSNSKVFIYESNMIDNIEMQNRMFVLYNSRASISVVGCLLKNEFASNYENITIENSVDFMNEFQCEYLNQKCIIRDVTNIMNYDCILRKPFALFLYVFILMFN